MRTFVFGAGASFHAGYPLASNMWPAMEQWGIDTYAADHVFRAVAEEMNRRFHLSQPFELVLTNLDSQIEGLVKENPITRSGNFEKHILLQLQKNLRSMIPVYFNSLRSRPAPVYAAFAADVLNPEDAVITFNYDLALDREMKRVGKWSVGNGYGFSLDVGSFGDSPCKLFKLHGSTNWHGELFQGMLGFFQGSFDDRSLGQRPVIDRGELEYLGYSNASDPQCHDGRARVESLIMPTANKRFFVETSLGTEWATFWDSLWQQAGESLKVSEEVYLIGYSIPKYDSRARELFRTKISSGSRIKVCCDAGTTSVMESSTRLGLTAVGPAPAVTFEKLVDRLKRH